MHAIFSQNYKLYGIIQHCDNRMRTLGCLRKSRSQRDQTVLTSMYLQRRHLGINLTEEPTCNSLLQPVSQRNIPTIDYYTRLTMTWPDVFRKQWMPETRYNIIWLELYRKYLIPRRILRWRRRRSMTRWDHSKFVDSHAIQTHVWHQSIIGKNFPGSCYQWYVAMRKAHIQSLFNLGIENGYCLPGCDYSTRE